MMDRKEIGVFYNMLGPQGVVQVVERTSVLS